ncbi:cell wall-binding repeat-containing protein [Diaminobutyricibacter sp. McL0608]|uniref:cell wall-binding repeat-containing protein n=1 Tax=Leifsonia sp. McL0608 TaxID=3143537 RepID=UPI0031F2EFDC
MTTRPSRARLRRTGLRAIAASALVAALCMGVAGYTSPASAAPGPYTIDSTTHLNADISELAVDTYNDTLYVADWNQRVVLAVDEKTQAVVATIHVASSPNAVAVDAYTGLVFVAGYDGSVSVIADWTNKLVGVLPAGAGADAVAVDETTGLAFVASSNTNTVTVVDEAKGAVTHTIPVGSFPQSIDVDQSTGMVYVVDGGDGTISVINSHTMKVVKKIAPPVPAYIARVDQDTGRLFVGAHTNGMATSSLFTIDPGTYAVTGDLTVPGAGGDLSIDLSTRKLMFNGNGLVVIDMDSLSIDTATGIRLDYLAVDQRTNLVFGGDHNLGTITVISEPVSITSDDPSALIIGQPSTTGFTARGPAPVTFAATAGSLPAGLTLDPSGALVGTPSHLGWFDYSITATDADGDTVTQQYSQQIVPATSRVSGVDRYGTGVAISQGSHPATAPVVFIASGTTFPDALAAGPAAVLSGGPLLLTAPTSLPQNVSAEIQRLQAHDAIIVGGTGAVSQTVADQVKALLPPDGSVTRLSGADRYATSRSLVSASFPGTVPSVYVATGSTFPDALSAGAAAASAHVPLVLVNGTSSTIDPATAALLRRLAPRSIFVAGGTGSVSAAMAKSLAAIAPVTRLSGLDRYATAAAVNAHAHPTASRAFLAQGLSFPDALAASAWAGSTDSPLYLAPSSCIPSVEFAAIEKLNVSAMTLVGGTGALGAAVEQMTSC